MQPGERCDHERLGAGVEGGLDDGSEGGGVIDRDVLGDPSRCFGSAVGVGVDAADPPVGVRRAERGGEVAEVLAGALLRQPDRTLGEDFGERRGDPIGDVCVVLGQG